MKGKLFSIPFALILGLMLAVIFITILAILNPNVGGMFANFFRAIAGFINWITFGD